LTQPFDKLVAINEIISRIEKSESLNTLAGLWKEVLPAGLFWKADKPRWMPVFQEYLAWASLEGPITNEFVKLVQNAHKWTWMIDVIKAKVISSPSGQIFAAHPNMSCPLRRV
jgi:hypothetical protein